MCINLKNRKGLSLHRNSPNSYPTLSHFVPWHFGHGGNVSESSSNLITSPHFVHLYKPFPGFSPVEYIKLKFKRLIKLFTRFIFIERRSFSAMISHVRFNSVSLPIFGSLSGCAVSKNVHVTKLLILSMLLFPAFRVISYSNIKDFISVLQLILISISFTHFLKILICKTYYHLLLNRAEKLFVMTNKKK